MFWVEERDISAMVYLLTNAHEKWTEKRTSRPNGIKLQTDQKAHEKNLQQ